LNLAEREGLTGETSTTYKIFTKSMLGPKWTDHVSRK